MLVVASILAQTLGPEGRGITAAAFSLQVILPGFLALGMPLAIRKRLISEKASAEIGGAIVVAAAGIPVVAAIAVVSLRVFDDLLTNSEGNLLIVLVASAPFVVVNRTLQQILVVRRQYLGQALIGISQALGTMVLIVAASVSNHVSVSVAFIGQLAGLVLQWIVTWSLVRVKPKLGIPSGLLLESLTYYPRDVVISLRERLDQFIALPLLGPAGAGIYSVAFMVGTLPTIVGGTVGLAAFEDNRESGRRQAPLEIHRFTHLSVGLTLATSTLVAITAPFAIPVFFGDSFRDALPLIWVFLFIFCLIEGARSVAVGVLNARGRGGTISGSEAIGLATGIGLASVLAPQWGPMALTLAVSMDLLFSSALLYRALDVSIAGLIRFRFDREVLVRWILDRRDT